MSLIDPADPIERQNEKLLTIAQSLMRRVEQSSDQSGLAYRQFERAALLESEVRARTRELGRTLDLLQESNARLEIAHVETETARANLTEAIETIDEGFALFDPDDRLVLSNSRFCRDFRDLKDGLVPGLGFADYVRMVAESRDLAVPKGQTPGDWARARLARHGDDHVVFNVSLIRDRWLQVSEHRTGGGGTVILQTDVTDIIRAERQERDEMRDRQARMLQATLDHLNQGVCIFDHRQKLVGWNKRMDTLLALPAGENALGLDFVHLLDRLRDDLTFHDGIDARRHSAWADRPARREAIAFEVTRGGVQSLAVFAQEMPDRGFVISFTDVTAERKAARSLHEMNEQLERRVRARTEELDVALQEAERANASKSRFVAAASHDLMQPLSAAKLFLSSLAEGGHAETRKIVGKTETALMAVEKIIEALLDISRLDAGKAAFRVGPVQLSRILGALGDEMTPIAAAKGIDLDIVESRLTVASDPAYLRRIVQNLLANAIRYTDTGRVLLGVRRNGRSARVEVWDTGIGIAEADQQTIFREFERLDRGRDAGGLGLGLAIVERACTGLGHELGLWSEPGRGSCFSLNVPICGPGPAAAVDAATPATGDSALRGLLVLLVENDAQLAGALTMMVEGQGAEVIHAETAEDALMLIEEIALVPDALLLDYRLGAGMTGADLYRAFRARHGPVPAAILSAERSADLRQRCRQLGLPLLPKPIDRRKLTEFLHGVGRAPLFAD